MRRPEQLGPCLVLGLLLGGCASDGGTPETAVRPSGYTTSADGHMNLALAESYLEKNDLAKAAERADVVLKSDPRWAQAHALRAVVYQRAGEEKKAEKSFDRALELAPKDGAILNAHAVWQCEHGRADLADREFALALADPGYHMPMQALANAGRCARTAGRLAAASDYLRRALVFAPTDRALLFLMADLELQQGKTFEAQAFIQRRDALGADGATLELAARIEDAAGNAQGAARYRARLHAEFPDYVPTGEGARSP